MGRRLRIQECTFEQFVSWCNNRACDGRWDLDTAMICLEAGRKVYEVKPLWGKKKARQKKWEEIRREYFKLDAEIEV